VGVTSTAVKRDPWTGVAWGVHSRPSQWSTVARSPTAQPLSGADSATSTSSSRVGEATGAQRRPP
jgi:hypothetical protein